ncbi:hypothetical protein [Mucilaginibacter sp. FT3.2]|uniref:hypothetical protein n=1 Tax=Mucilaginibacter sp. FT3.2 TaxID=2723090 RepID=UPI0016124AB2|nr:hypothetical protein [Mucilaginibacter sp. FT3.2]MBB6232083.1 hypothetical protein [Mucilaginibacter sp. FT3.2]
MTDKLIIDRMANKLFYYPGFYEGVIEVSNLFQFEDMEQFEAVWQDIKRFLKYYQYITSAVSDAGVCVETVFPFGTKDDIELVRLIMVSCIK